MGAVNQPQMIDIYIHIYIYILLGCPDYCKWFQEVTGIGTWFKDSNVMEDETKAILI